MKNLTLEKKTGFRSTLPFTIFEPNGQIFYSSDFTDKIEKGKALEFNLPAGEYKYDGSFIKLDAPIKVENIGLPFPERNIQRKRYNIVFGDNPNKCTIYYDTAEILFDSQYLNSPLYIKYGIYYHELGHHWYSTEGKADLFAVKKMLDKGFNPSQIGLVALKTLSPKSDERRAKLLALVMSLTKNEG